MNEWMNKQMNRPIRVVGVTLWKVMAKPWHTNPLTGHQWETPGSCRADKGIGPELAEQECQGVRSEH